MGNNGEKITEQPELNISGSGGAQQKNPVEGKEPPATDFKIVEIWIRNGQIMLDASETFWSDRCRALGVLELCKEIVKTAKAPEKPKDRIIPVKGDFLNGVRNRFRGRR